MFRPKFRIHWFIISIVAIPILCLIATSILLKHIDEDIHFIRWELEGLKAYRQAITLYFDVYEREEMNLIIDEIVNAKHDQTFKAWKEAKDALTIKHSKTVSKTELKKILQDLIRDIGDESNLILDPELESYYAVDILFNQVPLYAIWADNITSNRRPLPETLNYYFSKLNHAHNAISLRMKDNNLHEIIAFLKKDWESLPYKNPGIQSQESLAHAEKLAEYTISILTIFLNTSLVNHYFQRDLIILVVVGFYLVIVTLIIMSVRYYVDKHEVELTKERKKLLDRLAEKNVELEKFASAAAHDLKGPVRTMRSFAMLLKSEARYEPNSSANEYINIIESTAHRAERMINDLLGYTHATDEALAIDECDCAKEFNSVLEDLKAPIKSIQPVITTGKLPVITTVPSMFRRVLLNIVDNALKYHRPGVPLTIHFQAQRDKDNWVFSLSDNGIGIDNENTNMVFEPFKRLEPEVYKESSGIGLTACKKIIERLGGRIWIDAELAKGTTVYFTLPSHLVHVPKT